MLEGVMVEKSWRPDLLCTLGLRVVLGGLGVEGFRASGSFVIVVLMAVLLIG